MAKPRRLPSGTSTVFWNPKRFTQKSTDGSTSFTYSTGVIFFTFTVFFSSDFDCAHSMLEIDAIKSSNNGLRISKFLA